MGVLGAVYRSSNGEARSKKWDDSAEPFILASAATNRNVLRVAFLQARRREMWSGD